MMENAGEPQRRGCYRLKSTGIVDSWSRILSYVANSRQRPVIPNIDHEVSTTVRQQQHLAPKIAVSARNSSRASNPRLRTYSAQCIQRAIQPVYLHFLDSNFKPGTVLAATREPVTDGVLQSLLL